MPGRKTTTMETPTAAAQSSKKPRRANGEGSARKRSDGRVEVRVSLPDGTRKSVYGKDRKEAIAKAKKLQQEMDQGTYVPSSRETLAQYLDQWLMKKRLEWEDGTFINRQRLIEKHLIPSLGHIQLQQLTAQHIQKLYIGLLQKQLQASTIHRLHSILHVAFKQAIKERKIGINPLNEVTLPKMEKKEMRYLTTAEIERIIQAAPQYRHGCLYLLAVTTGMRRNELLALKWEDIDFRQGKLQVRRSLSYHNVDGTGHTYKEKSPKSRDSRRNILLPDFVIKALQDHRTKQTKIRTTAEEWYDLDLVFPNKKGQHQCPTAMYKTYKQFLRKLEIPDAPFHATRHGHATNLLELGENARVVQERLGHSDVSMTLRLYAHVTPTMQQQATTKLDARFGTLANVSSHGRTSPTNTTEVI